MPKVTGPLTQTAPTDTYPTHDSLIGLGGLREVATHAARNAIPNLQRREGMLVYTSNDTSYWKLLPSPWVGTDADWSSASLNSTTSTYGNAQYNTAGTYTYSASVPTTYPPSGPAGGDLTGTYPNPTLTAVTTASTVGSSSLIPIITYDAKGRIISTSTTALTGTVSSVSVTSANGLAGTITNPTTTPAITISTTVTGLLKGNGTAVSSAISGTDYALPNANTTGTASNVTGTVAIANGGTGSTTQNFVDLTNPQTVGGAKTFTGASTFAAILRNRTAVADTAYTVAAGDDIIAYTSLTATRAVTLPTSVSGREIIIKDESGSAGSFNITIIGTVDGATNKSISTAYGSLRLYGNGTNWFTY